MSIILFCNSSEFSIKLVDDVSVLSLARLKKGNSVSDNKFSHSCFSFCNKCLAGIVGLEPTKRESKSRVLPLHHIPILFI